MINLSLKLSNLSPNPTCLNPNPKPNTKPQPNPKPYPNTKPQPNSNPNFTNWEVAKEINVLLNVKIFVCTYKNYMYPDTL